MQAFLSRRMKLWAACGAAGLLTLGYLTRPPASPMLSLPAEPAAPLLDQEVQRREQLRSFRELQQIGPPLARHTVALIGTDSPPPLFSDAAPPAAARGPAGHGLVVGSGEVLTTAAALDGRDAIPLVLPDGARVEGRVVAVDDESDLVLLRVDPLSAQAATLTREPPPSGMLALAVSHDQGEPLVAPVFVVGEYGVRGIRISPTDLLPGTPLFTVEGAAFAVATGNAAGAIVLGTDAISRLRQQVVEGRGPRGALGLTLQEIDEKLRAIFPMGHVLVADVWPGSPAETAGIQPGDVVAAIGDTEIASLQDARTAIAAAPPQTGVTVRLMRGRQTLALQTTPTSALRLRAARSERRDVDAPALQQVLPASVLHEIDAQPEARLVEVGGRRVVSVNDARAQLGRARGPVLLYLEDARGRFFRVMEPVR